MKCGDCGWRVPPTRGKCVNFKCQPEVRSELNRSSGKTKWNNRFYEDTLKGKRCPFCTGEQHASGKPCWQSLCDRGPAGARCDCHWQMTGFGSPSGIIKEKIQAEEAKKYNARDFARVVI